MSLESKIRRLPITIDPDPRRVLLRPFIPSLIVKPFSVPEPNPRVVSLFSRVMHMDEASVKAKLDEVFSDFLGRHGRLHDIFAERFEQVRHLLPTDQELTEPRRILLGSYFTNEYSLESTALFNPGIFPSPDQSGLQPGECRVILSLRATGEGHISSITFRCGILDSEANLRLDPVSRYVQQPRPQPAARYDLATFRRKLQELGVEFEVAAQALASFRGVARRFDLRGVDDGVTFVDDYAHLPNEIIAVLHGARDATDKWGRVVAVFQPNRFNRMSVMSSAYADAFGDADVVVITDIYSSGTTPIPGVTGKLVVDAIENSHPGKKVEWIAQREDLVSFLASTLTNGDLCISMGCGDVAELPDEVISMRQNNRANKAHKR